MADNLNITAGSGTTIATDDVSGIHYQKVKLIESTAESTSATGVSGNPLRVDPTGSTAQPVTDNGGALTVDGTVAVSGTVAVTDNSSTLSVDDGSGSLTVDGTVTANLGATDNAVLDDIAADTEAIKTAVEGTLTVTGGGGGVEYTEGDTDASITGTALLMEGAGNALVVAQGTAADGLLVNLGSNNDITGTVAISQSGTANRVVLLDAAGTNAGGILAAGGDDQSNDLNQLITAGFNYVYDGSTWDRAKGDSTDGLLVNLGANNDVTVTGTVDLGATDNAVLDAIDAVLDTIKVDTEAIETAVEAIQSGQLADGHNVTIDNSTGAAAVNIQDGGNTITVDGTVTANLGATDNAVLDAIAASTAAIETAVEGTLTVTGGGGGVEYTEGDTDASITGSAAMMEVGSDTLQPLQGTVAGGLLVNLGGNNDVTVTGSITADLGANNDVTVTGTVDLGATDNAVLDQIELNTDPLLVVGGGVEATAIRVTLANDSTGVVSVDDNGGALTVDGTVTANLSATDNAVLDNIDADLTTIIGHVDGVEGLLTTIDADTGGILTSVQTLDNAISGSEMQVDVVGALPAGTNAIGKLAANTGVDIGDVDVTSLPALAAGTNAIGKVIPPDYDVTSHTAKAVKYYTSAGAATDGIIWSPAAGKRWHVTTLFLNVSAAATVTLEDDLAGGDSAVMKMELAANSGVAIPFGDLYPLTSGEDAADLIITTSAGNVYVTCVGYEI